MMRSMLVMAVALAACAPVTEPIMPPEHDIGLLAMLFEDARSIEKQLAPDFACVSLRPDNLDFDPPAAVVDSLAHSWKIPVVPGSQCRILGEGEGVAAPGMSGTGKWLRVTKLECQDPNHCTADVSYYVANLGAGGRSVVLERSSDGWRLTPTGAMWIS